MSLVSALGGIGQGVSQGIQDLNLQKQQKALEEQQAFQKTQNARLLAQQAEEVRVNEQLKGIKRTTPDRYGEGYEAAQARNAPVRDDNGQLMPGVQAGIARPEHEVLLDKAKILMDSSNRNDQIYGQQLMKQAQDEREYTGVQDVQNKFKSARELLQKDPEEFLKQYGPMFNQNKIGGAEVNGVTATPLNTPNGRIVSIAGPNNTPLHQMPLTRADLGRALRGMHMEELAGVNPKYASLAMQNEDLGLKRDDLGLKRDDFGLRTQAQKDDVVYKNRMASVYEQRNVIDEKEMKGKLSLWGAQAKEVGQKMDGFSQFLGQDDQGRIHGVLKNGKLGTLDAPLNKDGTPIQLMDKFTGAKSKKNVKIMSDPEGNLIAFDLQTGSAVHNIISGGLEVPLGITESKYKLLETKASKLGVPLHLGKDKEGVATIAYRGKDGEYYSTPEDAVKAKIKPVPVPK